MQHFDKIDNYRILSTIHESSRNYICRAETEDNHPVVLKICRNEYPGDKEISILNHEFKIVKSLENIPGIIAFYDLIRSQNRYMIVMEDIRGSSLDAFVDRIKSDLELFFYLAFKIVRILGEIHKHQVIHKDIKPGNIIYNPANRELRIIDFSLSSCLLKETQETLVSREAVGTFAYISPEQTGRMNRLIDYRSDFYSLGVTFYKFLTGQLPYNTTDTLEMIHCHIAKTAVPPHEISSEVPVSLSLVIMKLMAKMPEDRYQGIEGLEWDLKLCYQAVKEKKPQKVFFPGCNDISGIFRIPEKLYGREQELNTLLKSYHRILERKKDILIITGEPGIGKSTLIYELERKIFSNKTFFIHGKYDEFISDKPYPAIVQALTALIRQLLAEQEALLADWKQKILEAVGNMGRLLIDVIPELELVTGEQPALEKAEPGYSTERFINVFICFIKVFAARESPLILHLDDLQWIDATSLKLLEALFLEVDIESLLFIGTCRSREMDKNHPFMQLLNRLKEKGVLWQEMQISGLQPQIISRMLEDIFNKNINATNELAYYIHQKTGGNPFFIIQFLKTLYEKNLVYFRGQWQWDTEKIIQEQATENIAELLVNKIRMFPAELQELLMIISCTGYRVKTSSLAAITGTCEPELLLQAKRLFAEGIIVKSEDHIQFTHDRIREAAYASITETDRCRYHYRIGKALFAEYCREKSGGNLFKTVTQWNHAPDLLNAPEKRQLLELDLQAAARAGESIAYDAMLNYLDVCRELLPAACWQDTYDLALEVYENLAFAAFKNSDYLKTVKYCDLVIDKARDIYDKIDVYLVKGNYLVNAGREKEALQLHIQLLKKLGLKLPAGFLQLPYMLLKILRIKWLFKNRAADLFGGQPLTGRKIIPLLQVIYNIVPFLFILKPRFCSLLQVIALELSVKHKAAQFAGQGLLSWSNIMYAFGDYAAANAALAAGKVYAEKFKQPFNKAIIQWFEGRTVYFWQEHLKKSITVMQECLEVLIRNGHYQYTQAVFFTIHDCFLITGENRERVELFFKKNYSFFFRQQHAHVEKIIILLRQFQDNLQGRSPSFFKLDDADNKEADFLDYCRQTNHTLLFFTYYFFKFFLLFTGGRYRDALANAVLLFKYRSPAMSGTIDPLLYLLYGLALIRVQPGKTGRLKWPGKIKRAREKMQGYARRSPVNFLAPGLLLDAEIARARGRYNKAIVLYNQALEEAAKQEFTSVLALANESCAGFYRELGHSRLCLFYAGEAHRYFKQWGIIPKLYFLEEQYPRLTDLARQQAAPDLLSGLSIASTSSSNNLIDLVSIIKASQAIAGEIEMPRLVAQLIDIVTANAGAEKGVLILKNNQGRLQVEAVSHIRNKLPSAVVFSQPVEEYTAISHAIVRYVAKTRESLILANAAREGDFTRDPYIAGTRPLSVLCVPVMKQSELTGILYLENNLVTHAFSAQQLELVKILSGQAAAAIENARLYKNIQESESKYRTILETIEEGYFETNLRGAFTFVNDALCTITGFKKTELLAKNFRLMLKRESRKRVLKAFHRVYKNQQSLKSENLQVLKKNGDLIVTEISISLVKNQANEAVGFRGICQDITEKAAAEQLKIARDIADGANKAKSEFLADMSHEMRTPLNAILGFAELLGSLVTERVARGYLSAIAYSGETLLNLINDILDLSRIEAGKIILQNTVIHIPSLLGQIRQTFIHAVNKKNLKFYTEIAPTLPEHIMLDELRLRQILLNLVNNAVKFTEQGFIKIRVSSDQPESVPGKINLVFSVQDTGTGIPKNEQESIFETFRQRKGQDHAKYGGTGLGLSICKRLVEILNGSIAVMSEPGQGSIFSFTLRHVSLARPETLPGKALTVDINKVRFEKLAVLVADDNDDNRRLLSDYLLSTGITIHEAADGREALEKLAGCKTDLVLMDIKMPVIDGYEAIVKIKADNNLKQIPVIAVTASAMRDDEERIKKAGFSDVLKKPISRKDLINLMVRYFPYTAVKKEENPAADEPLPGDSSHLAPEVRKRLPELLHVLEHDLQPRWKELKSSFIMSEAERFTRLLNNADQKYNVPQLHDWQVELSWLLESLDFEKFSEKLMQFPVILEQIRELIGKK